MCIFDLSSREMIFQVSAHASRVKSLAFVREPGLLFAGSTDGHATVWDAATRTLVARWDDLHAKRTFLRTSRSFSVASSYVNTYGVADLKIVAGVLYSCGADGRVVRRLLPSGRVGGGGGGNGGGNNGGNGSGGGGGGVGFGDDDDGAD